MKIHFLLSICLFSTSLAFAETLTVQGSLPGPYPRAKTMYLEPTASASLPCEIGTIVFESGSTNAIKTCKDNGFGTGAWEAVGGGSTWTLSGSDLYPTTYSTVEVGIGTNAPTARLHVDSNANFRTQVMTLENDSGNINEFVTSGSPEGSVTGNLGDVAYDITGGFHVKTMDDGASTGWSTLAYPGGVGGNCGASAAFLFFQNSKTGYFDFYYTATNVDYVTNYAGTRRGIPQACAGYVTAMSAICYSDAGSSTFYAVGNTWGSTAGICQLNVANADQVYSTTCSAASSTAFAANDLLTLYNFPTSGGGMFACTAVVWVKYKG